MFEFYTFFIHLFNVHFGTRRIHIDDDSIQERGGDHATFHIIVVLIETTRNVRRFQLGEHRRTPISTRFQTRLGVFRDGIVERTPMVSSGCHSTTELPRPTQRQWFRFEFVDENHIGVVFFQHFLKPTILQPRSEAICIPYHGRSSELVARRLAPCPSPVYHSQCILEIARFLLIIMNVGEDRCPIRAANRNRTKSDVSFRLPLVFQAIKFHRLGSQLWLDRVEA